MSLVDIPNERLNDAFDEQFAVNVKGPFFGAKATIPHLMESEGCMVFTASGAGFQSAGGGSLYTATKHAVVGLIRQLAVELAPQIRVNGVAPGGTMTDLRGLESLGQHQESSFARPGMPPTASQPARRCSSPSTRGTCQPPISCWPPRKMPGPSLGPSSEWTPVRCCARGTVANHKTRPQFGQ